MTQEFYKTTLHPEDSDNRKSNTKIVQIQQSMDDFIPESINAVKADRNVEALQAKASKLESLLSPKVIDWVRCGIGVNYGGERREELLAQHYEPLLTAMAAEPEVLLSQIKAEAISEYQVRCSALYDEAFELLKNQCNVASDGMILMPAKRYSALIDVLNKFRELADESGLSSQ